MLPRVDRECVVAAAGFPEEIGAFVCVLASVRCRESYAFNIPHTPKSSCPSPRLIDCSSCLTPMTQASAPIFRCCGSFCHSGFLGYDLYSLHKSHSSYSTTKINPWKLCRCAKSVVRHIPFPFWGGEHLPIVLVYYRLFLLHISVSNSFRFHRFSF